MKVGLIAIATSVEVAMVTHWVMTYDLIYSHVIWLQPEPFLWSPRSYLYLQRHCYVPMPNLQWGDNFVK